VGGVLGKYSFGIYLIQMCFIMAGYHVLTGLSISNTDIVFYPLLFVSALGLSLLCAYLVHKLPYGELVLGRGERRTLNALKAKKSVFPKISGIRLFTMEPPTGFEPATPSLRMKCSAD
jgi:peptidoglycan/LPS O-acetylase OafA/YrhL